MRDLESLRWKPAFVVGLLSVIVFLVQMGLTLTDIPSISLVQEFTCIRQNPGVDPDTLNPEQCQTISVNREVNLIQLLSTLTTSAPVETLSVAGLVLFIGGGIGVAEAMVFTMISDVTFDRWRTISFQIAICSVLLADIVAAVSTPSLISDSAWTPLGLGALFIVIGFLLPFALPETLDILLAPSSQDRQQKTIPTLAELRASLAHLRRNGAAISLLTPAAALTLPIATTAASILSHTTPLRYPNSFAASSTLVAVRAGAGPRAGGAVAPRRPGTPGTALRAVLAVVEQAGFLVVGLILSGLLDAGLRNSEGRGGKQWLGLPLYIAAFLFALLALGLWLARPRELQQQQTPPLPNERQDGEGEPEQVDLGNLQERQPEGSSPKQPHQ
ncbi:hypothetical protein PG988_008455 [Apiospora saccharicola]